MEDPHDVGIRAPVRVHQPLPRIGGGDRAQARGRLEARGAQRNLLGARRRRAAHLDAVTGHVTLAQSLLLARVEALADVAPTPELA